MAGLSEYSKTLIFIQRTPGSNKKSLQHRSKMDTFVFLDGSPDFGVKNRLVWTREDATVSTLSLG